MNVIPDKTEEVTRITIGRIIAAFYEIQKMLKKLHILGHTYSPNTT